MQGRDCNDMGLDGAKERGEINTDILRKPRHHAHHAPGKVVLLTVCFLRAHHTPDTCIFLHPNIFDLLISFHPHLLLGSSRGPGAIFGFLYYPLSPSVRTDCHLPRPAELALPQLHSASIHHPASKGVAGLHWHTQGAYPISLSTRYWRRAP